MQNQVKVGIIGAGPAGIAAAVQLKRSGICPLLFEKERVGGLLHNACLVENYPGFPGGIGGKKMVSLFQEHLDHYSIVPLYEEVMKVKPGQQQWQLFSQKDRYHLDYVIIATGTQPCTGDFASSSPRVLYEVYPLLDKKDCLIGIIGGGDAAFDYALNLSQKNMVEVVYRSRQPRCLPLLHQRAKKNPRITLYSEKRLKAILEENQKLQVLLDNSKSRHIERKWDYMVLAIGREPTFPEIIQGADDMISSTLFFAGDVKNGSYRQTAIAVGQGIESAMRIFFEEKKG